MTRTQYYLSYPQGFVYLAGDMGWALEVGCHHSHSINAGSVGWLEGRQTFQHQGAGRSGAPVTFQRLWFFVLFAGANKTKKQMSYTYLFIMICIFYLHRNYYYNSIWAFEQCDLDVTLHCCPFESISISRCFQGLELHQWSYTAVCSFWKQHSGVAAQCLGAVVGVIPDGFLGNVKVELSEMCQGKISGVCNVYIYIHIIYILG